MSRTLAILLGVSADELSRQLAHLERSHHDEPVDVRLIGDIAGRSARIHRHLGLDPADTTPRELYMALRHRVRDDNKAVAQAIGGAHENAVSEMTPLVIKAAMRMLSGRTVWAMKPGAAQDLLRVHPPKKLKKVLGYKKISDMLAEESSFHLMSAARYIEDEAWNTSFTKSYESLTPDDFEEREIIVDYLDRAAYVEALEPSEQRHRLVLHSKEMGTITIAPTRENVIRGYTLRTLSLVLHYADEITAVSSAIAYRRHQAEAFGGEVIRVLLSDRFGHGELGGRGLHWRSVQSHAAQNPAAHQSEHLQGYRWHRRAGNDMIAALAETLEYWHGHAVAAKLGDEPVSFHLIDLATDEAAGTAYEERSLAAMRRELETELMRRYLEKPSIRAVAWRRLNIS